jgi:hypothetical protein
VERTESARWRQQTVLFRGRGWNGPSLRGGGSRQSCGDTERRRGLEGTESARWRNCDFEALDQGLGVMETRALVRSIVPRLAAACGLGLPLLLLLLRLLLLLLLLLGQIQRVLSAGALEVWIQAEFRPSMIRNLLHLWVQYDRWLVKVGVVCCACRPSTKPTAKRAVLGSGRWDFAAAAAAASWSLPSPVVL